MSPDYSTITELPETQVMPIQVERSHHRYHFALPYCEGKDVLEVACGGGQGLGLLATKASKVYAGDCDPINLRYAQETYQNNPHISIKDLDAHQLPFDEKSIDTILLYEAIYYLKLF